MIFTAWDWRVELWWLILSAISILNITLWFRLKPQNQQQKILANLAAFYVFVCAFRSFFPRVDAQRITLIDSWISSVAIGRSAATVAELAFVCQWAVLLYLMGREGRSKVVMFLSYLIVPLIFIAECCSWYGIVTTNFLGHVIEESLWGISSAIFFVGLFLSREKLEFPTKKIFNIMLVAFAIYTAYMAFVDVPMYWERYVADENMEKTYLSLGEGFKDAVYRQVNTQSFEDWGPEMMWMSLYFSFGVWGSLLFARLQEIRGRQS